MRGLTPFFTECDLLMTQLRAKRSLSNCVKIAYVNAKLEPVVTPGNAITLGFAHRGEDGVIITLNAADKLCVAAHEVGHVLDRPHNMNEYHLMYEATSWANSVNDAKRLENDEVSGLKEYGAAHGFYVPLQK